MTALDKIKKQKQYGSFLNQKQKKKKPELADLDLSVFKQVKVYLTS